MGPVRKRRAHRAFGDRYGPGAVFTIYWETTGYGAICTAPFFPIS